MSFKSNRSPITLSIGLKLFITVSLTEALIMFVLSYLRVETRFSQLSLLLIDTFTLTAVASVAVFYFIVRPMRISETMRKKQDEELILRHELLDNAIIDNIPSGIAFLDNDFILRKYNPAYGDLIRTYTPYAPGQALGMSYFDYVPGSRTQVEDWFRMVRDKGQPIIRYGFELKIKKGNEEIKTYWDTSIAPVLNIEGRTEGILILTQDVTERKKAEDAIRKSQEHVKNIIDSSLDMIISVDKDRRIVEFNKAAQEVFGYSREEVLGKHVDILYANPEKGLAVHNITLKNGRHVQEILNKRENGAIFPVLLSASVLQNPEGETVGVMGVSRDITEWKLAEESLRESEKRYKRLVGSITDYIYTVSVENGQPKETTHGPGCVAVTGYTSEEYNSDPSLWYKMIFEADREAVVEQSTMALKGDIPHPLEHRLIHKDGSIRWVKNTIVPHFDEQYRVIAHDGLISDITERKKLEEQLRHAQKMEAIGQLAGGVAHDFNNILTAILGYGSILKMKMDENDIRSVYVDQILASSERAASLTQSLLTFGRKSVIVPKPINLNDVVVRMEKLLSRVISENVELTATFTDKYLTVMADAGQLEQVLINLCTNARDAMPEGGLLNIKTELIELGGDFTKTHGFGNPGMYACISVSDTGTGMTEDTKKRIFEPFFTTKEVGKGTGLGLAIVYSIIKQHNGYLDVYSEPDKGTTFKIYLPLIKSEVCAERYEEPLSPARGTETILLAEDDADVRKMEKAVLEEFGYKVIEASDGEEAIQKFMNHNNNIHLCLLDIVMPRKSGKDAYEAIKKMTPDMKVLFASGYTSDFIHKKEILERGLNFIAKPASPTALLKKVRGVLDE